MSPDGSVVNFSPGLRPHDISLTPVRTATVRGEGVVWVPYFLSNLSSFITYHHINGNYFRIYQRCSTSSKWPTGGWAMPYLSPFDHRSQHLATDSKALAMPFIFCDGKKPFLWFTLNPFWASPIPGLVHSRRAARTGNTHVTSVKKVITSLL